MIKAWLSFVAEHDPDVIVSHNIVGFDFKYLFTLAKKYKHWRMVECVEDGQLLSREKIFERVLLLIKPLLI